MAITMTVMVIIMMLNKLYIMEKNDIIWFVGSFLAGGFMSLLIWFLTTKLLSPKMKLSDEIARRPSVGFDGKNQYFLKIQNVSKRRDIYDITCHARYHFSNNSFYTETLPPIPLLQSKSKKDACKWERKLELKNLNLLKTPNAVQEKYIDSKSIEIKNGEKTEAENVEKNELQVNIDEFFQKEEQGYLEMIVICYDAFSGAKRCVLSKKFELKDIKNGDFRNGSMKVEGHDPNSSTESYADSYS